MHYYVDGYNLLFVAVEKKQSLKTARAQLVLYLQKRFAALHLQGTLVFDGAHRRDEESGLSYPSPLVVAYSPKGQTADEYILEHIEQSRRKSQVTVVTNDRNLKMHAQSLGAQALSNSAFIQRLKNRKKRGEMKEPRETEHQIERLNEIFEKRLKEEG